MSRKREQLSTVKIRVREKALTLGDFTIDEIIHATGLKPNSVRNEIRNMRKEGLLTSIRTFEPFEGVRGAGRPPRLYKLSPLKEKRLALAHEVSSFYLKTPSAPPRQPDVRAQVESVRPVMRGGVQFKTAASVLDKAMGMVNENEPGRAALLERAGDSLRRAWDEEVRTAADPVAAVLTYEKARLEYLTGNLAEAERLFGEAGQAFSADNSDARAASIEEYLQAIPLQRQLANNAVPVSHRAQAILRILSASAQTSWATHPVAALLHNLLAKLMKEHQQALVRLAGLLNKQEWAVPASNEPSSFGPYRGMGVVSGGIKYAPAVGSPAAFQSASYGVVKALPDPSYVPSARDTVLAVAATKGRISIAQLINNESTVGHYAQLKDESHLFSHQAEQFYSPKVGADNMKAKALKRATGMMGDLFTL